MKATFKKIIIIGFVIIISIFGISKLIITPSKAGIITLDKVINESTPVNDISEEDMNTILKFHKSISDANLPEPKLKYDKLIKLNNLVHQEISIFDKHPRISNGNYQVSFNFSFIEYSEEAYNRGEGYVLKEVYNGSIYFEMEKTGLNKWRIKRVETNNMAPTVKNRSANQRNPEKI